MDQCIGSILQRHLSGMGKREITPGEFAPEAGTYELLDIFGSPTRLRVTLALGEPLPRAPRGFLWMLAEENA
jgi:hypothetical protein